MANSEKPVVEATLLAIEELNEKGGVLGRPVEAVVEDGASRPSLHLGWGGQWANPQERE